MLGRRCDAARVPSKVGLVPLCLLLLVAACGESSTSGSGGLVHQVCETTPEGYTICDPSEPLPAGATPPPPPTVVVASDRALAEVPLGTPAAEATSQLAARLGLPDVEETSCQREELRESLDVPLRAERLRWENISAYLTTMTSGERVLTGWAVVIPHRESWKYKLQLPYGLRLEEPVSTAIRKVPRAKSETPADGRDLGSLLISTPDVPDLVLISHELEGNGEVYSVAYDPEGCR